MLSLERTKELLSDPGLTDEEIREIRDGFYQLAQIIFEKWREDKKAGKLKVLKHPSLNKTEPANTPPEREKTKRKPPLYFTKQER